MIFWWQQEKRKRKVFKNHNMMFECVMLACWEWDGMVIRKNDRDREQIPDGWMEGYKTGTVARYRVLVKQNREGGS